MTYYDITPVAKPRQTRSDKWKQRPAVMRYRAFKDECRAKGLTTLPEAFTVIFYVPMPKSWSIKKRAAMNEEACQQKPDIDNLLKALMDGILEDDAHIWNVTARKYWSEKPGVQIIANI